MPVALDPLAPTMPAVSAAPAVIWAARALTFFNVLVLLWLGLTVLLNAEPRRLGAWLTGGGLVLGGLCSIARASAQAALPLAALAPIAPIAPAAPLDPWWRASWLPFAGASYLWSVVLTWYAGRLRSPAEWRSLAGLSVLGLGVLLLLVESRLPEIVPAPAVAPLPFPGWLGALDTVPGEAHVALAAYLTFALLCVGQGLHALYYPRSRDRFMGELAWRRARPWLAATSLVTLGLSLVVGLAVTGVGVSGLPAASPGVLDLAGAALLAAQVVLLGQAIVSYEVFTGKTLPRRGLARYWRNALILAAGFGGLMAVSLGLPLDQSYRLLLALVVVAVFYALLSWRSFVERERSLDQLRPFVASERLVDHLLTPPATGPATAPKGHLVTRLRPPRPPLPSVGAAEPFRALCQGLLGARVGYLCPLGPLASLAGPPLAGPEDRTPPADDLLAALVARTSATRQLCLPVDPARHGGAVWAVPLRGERGLIGLLLLGEKRDGSLYAEEEIEIAQAAGERLIDARAAGELARRLLLLQRRRLAEDQLLDGRVRRALHDDVLPLLHTALLMLDGSQRRAAGASPDAPPEGSARSPDAAAPPGPGADRQVSGLLADAHRQIAALLAELPPALGPDIARLGLIGALRRVAEDLGSDLDDVAWQVDPAAERASAELSPLAAEILFGAAREAIRNAARHGRVGDRSRPLHLRISVALDADDPRRDGPSHDGRRGDLTVRVEDDGVGLNGGTDTRGSGQGLILHATLLAVLGGALAAEPAPGHGTRVTLRLPAPE
jgi:signal transduction histidine kinase